ncbi:hypothetical protein BGZ72_011187 [Mortierella alpina]|nr:hypothetical protein BGZ72_011187 [Mortierella alpina]
METFDLRLHRDVTRGSIPLPDADLAADMYETMIQVLGLELMAVLETRGLAIVCAHSIYAIQLDGCSSAMNKELGKNEATDQPVWCTGGACTHKSLTFSSLLIGFS